MDKEKKPIPSPPRTLEEIDIILAKFEEQFSSGRGSIESICEELNVPVATLYRWRRRREARRTAEKYDSKPPEYSIEKSIEAVCNTDVKRADYISALCFLIAWSRWPSNPETHELTALSIAMRYVSRRQAAVYVSDLDLDSRAIFERFMRIDDLTRIYSLDSPAPPYMDEFDIHGHPFTERDVIAEVTNYLVSAPFDPQRTSTRPSLNKAFYILENGGFKYGWPYSQRSFKELWKRYAAAAPFLFVETYCSPLEWLVDPSAGDFIETFDAIAECPDEVRKHLAHVKWVIELLQNRLDPRAIANIRFPIFPARLVALPVKVPGLGRKATKLLAALV